jgi:flagellar protein FliS
MSFYARQAYLETQIMQADPLELVRLLYKGAIEAVGKAREHLRSGRISERSHQVSRAIEILAELSHSLNLEQGGSVAQNLARLYDYMVQRLVDANIQQVEAPLEEVERLLATLYEAWTQVPEKAGGQTDTASMTALAGSVGFSSTSPAVPMPSWGIEDTRSTYERTYIAG